MTTPDLPPLPEPRLWYDPETQQCSSMVPLRPTYEPQWDEDDMRSYGDARAAAAVLAERERCANIIETYQVPVGNSRSGELAAEWTMDALREVRAAIRAEPKKEQQP